MNRRKHNGRNCRNNVHYRLCPTRWLCRLRN
nr:MAG TPA: HELP motif [Bacteriophage sp.]